jgi:hypothetical protein
MVRRAQAKIQWIEPMTPIDQKWIEGYVNELLSLADKLAGPMRNALALRAEHAMDLVKAWREHVGEAGQ